VRKSLAWRQVAAVAIVAWVAGPLLAKGAEEPAARPNVLFIAVDDLNDWIGCMKGHAQAHTPNMDRLAARGVLFTNAHCAAPVCLASRTAVLTGLKPEQSGVYSNWGKTKGGPLAKDQQLPVRLTASGYETLGTGKLYHGTQAAWFDEYFDTEQRWSPFTEEQSKYNEDELPTKGSESPRHVIKAGPGRRDWVLPLNGLPSERNAQGREGESFDWGPAPVADEEMGDVRITDWALQKLSAKHEKPFFLGVGYYRPHIPLFAPEEDFKRLPPVEDIQLPQVLGNDLDDLGPEARKVALDAITAGTHDLVTRHGQWKEAVRAYLACIALVDRQVGRLLDSLDASPHADNTWIILWSDHGWHLGEKQHWGKWTAWRQATRVPLIIVPPRQHGGPAGKTCDEPVSLIDLYPTIMKICQAPVRSELKGISLLPLVSDPGHHSGRAVLTTVDPGNHALSTRGWRYIRYRTGEEELYDTMRDPHEWHNLAGDDASREKLSEMRHRLDTELGTPGKS
jgi:arylsulfatase A-like enzyme